MESYDEEEELRMHTYIDLQYGSLLGILYSDRMASVFRQDVALEC